MKRHDSVADDGGSMRQKVVTRLASTLVDGGAGNGARPLLLIRWGTPWQAVEPSCNNVMCNGRVRDSAMVVTAGAFPFRRSFQCCYLIPAETERLQCFASVSSSNDLESRVKRSLKASSMG